jgi:hypothetical protein
MTESTATREAGIALRSAFDNMIVQLQAARDVIDKPDLYPVPASDRNLAEGYRYLLGFILGGIERALDDPLYPRFRRSIQPMNRSTIDNPDAVYLAAEIDGNYSYRLKGRAGDSSHWRGAEPAGSRRAPQYVIFELASGYSGDSGSLQELMPGSRINTSTLDCHAIQVDAEGGFEILIGPEKPAGYTGNFMISRRDSRGKTFVGRFLTCRELFHDWENEDLLDLEILRVGCEGEPRPPLNSALAADMLDTVGRLTNHQMRFWNEFYAVTLEAYGKTPGGIDSGSGRPFMPTNDMNPPNALGIATGGGQSTNIYSGGIYKLTSDEALIIESRVPVKPVFLGFHLANLWGESLDFESYQSSLNASQMVVDDDGVYRWVVCHRDPAVANWLDTTGLEHGFMTVRYTYEKQPPTEQWPTLKVTKVGFADIGSSLPPGTPTVTKVEREANILQRHRHVQRRYRQY